MENIIRSIISDSINPAFNLAAEEVLLRELQGDFNFYYINDKSVIAGKHQNAYAEADHQYLEDNGIGFFRRLSGGGTVFHDLGNINFCFIRTGQSSELVNFKKAVQPVLDILIDFGVPVRFGARNDLLVNYKKISGLACHVYKQRVMHHGTLLFNSNLDQLNMALRTDPTRFTDKAVKSVRSHVMNISELLPGKFDATTFLSVFESKIRNLSLNASESVFSPIEMQRINSLASSKYLQESWNFWYGPPYSFRKRKVLGEFVFMVELRVVKGIVESMALKSNYPDANFVELFKQFVTGKPHSKSFILESLPGHELSKYNFSANQLTSLLF